MDYISTVNLVYIFMNSTSVGGENINTVWVMLVISYLGGLFCVILLCPVLVIRVATVDLWEKGTLDQLTD